MSQEQDDTTLPQQAAADRPSDAAVLPSVSVILPTRSEFKVIEKCLRSLAAQDYEGHIEVVIAEADEPDAIAEIASPIFSNLKVLHNHLKLTPYGIRAAIAASTGDYLVRCDGHTAFPPHYIRTAIDTLRRTGAGNVGGQQRAEGQTLVQRAIAAAMNSFAGAGNSPHRMPVRQEGPADTAMLGAMSREHLDAIGGWGYRYIRNDDYELNYRFRRNGFSVWYDPALTVEYYPRSRISELALQYFRYGRSKARVVLDHPASIRFRHTPAPLLVLSLAVTAGLAVLGQAMPVAALATLYGAFVLSATAVSLVRRRDPASLLLPLVLPVMHLSYGAGFYIPARPLPIEPTYRSGDDEPL